MAQEQSPLSGPDLTKGITLAEFFDGKLAGHVGDQEVLLVHSGTEFSPSLPIAVITTGRSLKGL